MKSFHLSMLPNIGYYFYFCRRHAKYQFFFQEVCPTKSDKLVHN